MSWIQEFFQGCGSKQIELDKLEKLLDGQADPAQKFLIREEQIDRQRGVELDKHGIFRVADERFDTQILLDFPEEDFDLPTVFVNVGDGFGRKPEVIGQKLITLAAFRVTIADAA